MTSSNWPSNQPDWQTRFAESDKAAGIEITEDFEPFTQRNDVFNRVFWDERVSSKKTLQFFKSYRVGFKPRKGAGFSRKDLALRNASWSVSDLFSNRSNDEGKREGFQSLLEVDSPVARDQIEIDDEAEFTNEVKSAAKLFGADLVGVTEIDERWHYRTRVDVRDFSETDPDLPDGMTTVIMMAHAMDYNLVKTYPSALAGAATGAEYSHEAAIVTQMVTFLRQLGMYALDSMRLEMGYGHWKSDLITEFNPIEAGLEKLVNWKKDFVGKAGLEKQMALGNRKQRVILEIDSVEAPCQPGEAIFEGEKVVGSITSAAYGYRSDKNLAMGYVDPQYSGVGTQLSVFLLAQKIDAKICQPTWP